MSSSWWDGLRTALPHIVEGTATAGTALIGALGEGLERQRVLADLEPVPREHLELPLRAARMSVLAYETDEETIRRGCLAHGLQLLQFCPQEAIRPGASTPVTGRSPQWFVAAADRGNELYVVFRGTKGFADVFRDACVNPERQGADKFHSGFLSAVRDDAVLREVLRLHLRDDAALFACGHSLGGALAMTLLSADGLLPPTHTGSRTAVALGSPAVAHGQIARRCRTILVVQDADPVPRLLGASMDITRGLFQASPVGIGLGSDILESMSQYRHPPELEMVYLTRGNAYAVPTAKQKAVLNLHEALGPTTLFTGAFVGAWNRDHDQDAYAEAIASAAKNRTAVPGIPVVPGVPVG